MYVRAQKDSFSRCWEQEHSQQNAMPVARFPKNNVEQCI